MRLIIYHQAEHLAAYTRQQIEILDREKQLDLVLTTELPEDFLMSDYILWLGGAVPLLELTTTAKRFSAYKKQLLCIGTAALAMSAYLGAKISATTVYNNTETMLQINVPNSILGKLPRQCQVPILLPQFQLVNLPNELSPLAKTAEGKILAWKHRNQSMQGIVFSPVSLSWQSFDGLQILQSWLNL